MFGRFLGRPPSSAPICINLGGVCCFVWLTRYWGIVTVPGFPRVNRPQTTWGGRILILHLNYVDGYIGPLSFLSFLGFEFPLLFLFDRPGRPTTTPLTTRGFCPGGSVVFTKSNILLKKLNRKGLLIRKMFESRNIIQKWNAEKKLLVLAFTGSLGSAIHGGGLAHWPNTLIHDTWRAYQRIRAYSG